MTDYENILTTKIYGISPLYNAQETYLCRNWLSQVKAWEFSTFCAIIF